MESTTYRSEKNRLLMKEITPEEAIKIAEDLWRDDRVRQVAERLNEPLDEYVRIFVGITGQTAVDHNQFIAFADSVLSLRRHVERDQLLTENYLKLEPVDRATPILAVEEIVRLILMAVTSGMVSGIAGTLVKQFLSRGKKERIDVLLQMLLSSPIPALLSKHELGLSVKEIAEEAQIAEADIGYFLAKYEERGWVSKERRDKKEIWIIKNSSIIQDFEP